MKLEIKHLAPYYIHNIDVKIISRNRNYKVGSTHELNGQLFSDFHRRGIVFLKPILHPISDLYKIMDILCPYYSEYPLELVHDIKSGDLSYREMQLLFKNHYDVFGLIDKGLAIDVNTLTNVK